MSRTRQMLCAFYALVALTALVMTWSQNLQYSGGALGPPMQYLLDLKATPAARSFTVDIGLFLLAGAALMVVEARKLGPLRLALRASGLRYCHQRHLSTLPDRARTPAREA